MWSSSRNRYLPANQFIYQLRKQPARPIAEMSVQRGSFIENPYLFNGIRCFGKGFLENRHLLDEKIEAPSKFVCV